MNMAKRWRQLAVNTWAVWRQVDELWAVGVLLLLIVSTIGLAYRTWPGLVLCIGFWLVAVSFNVLNLRIAWLDREKDGRFGQLRVTAWTLFTVGGLLNAAVTIGNSGHMPVRGLMHAHGVWVPMAPGHSLQWLADIHSGTSLGDVLLCLSMGILLLHPVVHAVCWFTRTRCECSANHMSHVAARR